jgi:hypothetical protein
MSGKFRGSFVMTDIGRCDGEWREQQGGKALVFDWAIILWSMMDGADVLGVGSWELAFWLSHTWLR